MVPNERQLWSALTDAASTAFLLGFLITFVMALVLFYKIGTATVKVVNDLAGRCTACMCLRISNVILRAMLMGVSCAVLAAVVVLGAVYVFAVVEVNGWVWIWVRSGGALLQVLSTFPISYLASLNLNTLPDDLLEVYVFKQGHPNEGFYCMSREPRSKQSPSIHFKAPKARHAHSIDS